MTMCKAYKSCNPPLGCMPSDTGGSFCGGGIRLGCWDFTLAVKRAYLGSDGFQKYIHLFPILGHPHESRLSDHVRTILA